VKKLLYYKPRVVTDEVNFTLPGFRKFAHFFSLFHHDVVIVDRTGTIQMPVYTHALFPMPSFRVQKKTYEEICNERALELLVKAELQGLGLYVFYSGGIDSTTVLVSLFKNATPVQKENITVLLSENSIIENPTFYKEHLLGKVRLLSSANFMHLLGTEAIFVSGEHNDQLFGSDVIG